jgi:hypothetical protein
MTEIGGKVSMTISVSKFKKTIKICGAPALVWDALTKPDLMKQWMSETPIDIITNWTVGNPITIRGPWYKTRFENKGCRFTI